MEPVRPNSTPRTRLFPLRLTSPVSGSVERASVLRVSKIADVNDKLSFRKSHLVPSSQLRLRSGFKSLIAAPPAGPSAPPAWPRFSPDGFEEVANDTYTLPLGAGL